MTDHKSEARNLIEVAAHGDVRGDAVMFLAAAAQVHALLALVEAVDDLGQRLAPDQ